MNRGTSSGDILVNEHTAELLPKLQKETGFDRIALDFEHNTVPGSPEYERTREPREIAGYGTPKVIKGFGVVLDKIDYTPLGRATARNYTDVSAALQRTSDGIVCFLHSVALTRAGQLTDLRFVQLSGHDMLSALFNSNIYYRGRR